MRASLIALPFVVACGGKNAGPDGPDAQVLPTPNPAREIVDTKLSFDVTALTGTAIVTFAPGPAGATVEVGDLAFDSVKIDTTDVAFAPAAAPLHDIKQIDLALPASDQPIPVTFTYHYKAHEQFTGASSRGFTFLWPYYCGNLFPCHSDPSDGTTFSLDLTGVPAGKTAIATPGLTNEAPSYQVAWTIDAYIEKALGTTTAGTQISLFHRAGEEANATAGGANLVGVFDWYEKTIGPYRFGNKVGGVAISWPIGAFGGMEHHPRWHVAKQSFSNEDTQAHEAAHGWFGDGIRIACWEDFVLSEGTVTYLSGRALEVVNAAAGQKAWADKASELAQVPGDAPVWPNAGATCNSIDILKDNLYQNAPYMRGAFFYRALADKLGADKIDQVLATFYAAHAGKSARMAEMLDTIQSVTGYDPTACAQTWLSSTTTPTPGPCP